MLAEHFSPAGEVGNGSSKRGRRRSANRQSMGPRRTINLLRLVAVEMVHELPKPIARTGRRVGKRQLSFGDFETRD